jgi:hypothetical protein
VSRHLVDISLGSENCEEIEDIQEELSIERRQALDQVLIYSHNGVWIETPRRRRLSFNVTHGFRLVAAQRLTERSIVPQRNNGLREVIEVPS